MDADRRAALRACGGAGLAGAVVEVGRGYLGDEPGGNQRARFVLAQARLHRVLHQDLHLGDTVQHRGLDFHRIAHRPSPAAAA